jgi:hypothetical protein
MKQAGGNEAPVSVVGIGASAGGLEAIQELLRKLPDNTGMAFVIIQHLSPDYKSMLTEILCKYTMMPVLQAENGQKLERIHCLSDSSEIQHRSQERETGSAPLCSFPDHQSSDRHLLKIPCPGVRSTGHCRHPFRNRIGRNQRNPYD